NLRDFEPRSQLVDQPVVYVNPLDASEAGVGEGATVRVRSAHGSLTGTVTIDASLRPGAVAIPFGFRVLNANHLVDDDVVNPLSGMPRFSGLEIALERL